MQQGCTSPPKPFCLWFEWCTAAGLPGNKKPKLNQKNPTLSGILFKAKHSSMLNNYCQNWICKCSELGWDSVFCLQLPNQEKAHAVSCIHTESPILDALTWQLNPFASSKSFTSPMHKTYSVYALGCHFSTQESIHKITCKVASSCYSYPKKEKGFSKIHLNISSHRKWEGKKKHGSVF